MSQENIEVVRRVIAALAEGDRESVWRYFDPEVVVDASRQRLNPATYVGIDGLRRMVAAADAVWDGIRTEPLDLLDAGDRVVVFGLLMGKGKGSGVEVRRPTAQVWTLRGGRVVRWDVGYTNRAQALEAAGLRE